MFSLIKKFILCSMLIASLTFCQQEQEQSKDDQGNLRFLPSCIRVGLACVTADSCCAPYVCNLLARQCQPN